MQPKASTLSIRIDVNGSPVTAVIDTRRTLLDFVRETCGLTGTKKGCDHGQCGACTVLIDGKRMLSCLKLAASVQDRAVTTIEGLVAGDALHPVQEAFLRHDAYQCGYCTPGQIISAVAAIADRTIVTREQVSEFMSGNICRCGAYNGIVDAILDVKADAAV